MKWWATVLQDIRREKNLTVESFGAVVGASPSAIFYWFSGGRSIRVETLARVCRRLDKQLVVVTPDGSQPPEDAKMLLGKKWRVEDAEALLRKSDCELEIVEH